jgi:hypothetical protein
MHLSGTFHSNSASWMMVVFRQRTVKQLKGLNITLKVAAIYEMKLLFLKISHQEMQKVNPNTSISTESQWLVFVKHTNRSRMHLTASSQ